MISDSLVISGKYKQLYQFEQAYMNIGLLNICIGLDKYIFALKFGEKGICPPPTPPPSGRVTAIVQSIQP